MGFLSVVVAGLAGFLFGAVWYTALAKEWVRVSGVPVDETGAPANQKDPLPYVSSLISAILVAGMMRHVFALSMIDSFGKGLLSGLGIGVFLVSPWIVTFYSFSARPRKLMLIDCGYATFGCGTIGAVLTLF